MEDIRAIIVQFKDFCQLHVLLFLEMFFQITLQLDELF